jgi:hypothetical protein
LLALLPCWASEAKVGEACLLECIGGRAERREARLACWGVVRDEWRDDRRGLPLYARPQGPVRDPAVGRAHGLCRATGRTTDRRRPRNGSQSVSAGTRDVRAGIGAPRAARDARTAAARASSGGAQHRSAHGRSSPRRCSTAQHEPRYGRSAGRCLTGGCWCRGSSRGRSDAAVLRRVI